MKRALLFKVLALLMLVLSSTAVHAGRDKCHEAGLGTINDNSARKIVGDARQRNLIDFNICHADPRNIRIHVLCKDSGGIRALPENITFYGSSTVNGKMNVMDPQPVRWEGRTRDIFRSFKLPNSKDYRQFSSNQDYVFFKVGFDCPNY